MSTVENYCPCCKSYSGVAFEVVEPASNPRNERIKCLRCYWVGDWDDCIKTYSKGGDDLIIYRTKGSYQR